MSFMDRIKKAGETAVNAANKQKIRAEIALVEREIRGRKLSFGIDVYDLMEKTEKSKKFWSSGEEGEIRAPYDSCKKDLTIIEKEKEQKQQQIDVLEVRVANKAPAATFGDKMRNAGSVTKETAQKTKIQGEMLLLDRQMKLRKQEFGVEMYDVMHAAEISKNWKASDKDIRACYELAKDEITVKETKKQGKQHELDALEAAHPESSPVSTSVANSTPPASADASNPSPAMGSV